MKILIISIILILLLIGTALCGGIGPFTLMRDNRKAQERYIMHHKHYWNRQGYIVDRYQDYDHVFEPEKFYRGKEYYEDFGPNLDIYPWREDYERY